MMFTFTCKTPDHINSSLTYRDKGASKFYDRGGGGGGQLLMKAIYTRAPPIYT